MDPLEFLFSLETLRHQVRPRRTSRTLCARARHPQDAFRSVIVAGTNGKGSVTAMVDTRAARRRASRGALHLAAPRRLEERFVIDGRPVDAGASTPSCARVRGAAEQTACRDGDAPGAARRSSRSRRRSRSICSDGARVDVAVLEVGLGGRFDATNIVSPDRGRHHVDRFRSRGSISATRSPRSRARRPASSSRASRSSSAACRPDAARRDSARCRAERSGAAVDATAGCRADTPCDDGRPIVDSRRRPAARTGRLRAGAARARTRSRNALVAVRLLEALATSASPSPAAAIEPASRGRLAGRGSISSTLPRSPGPARRGAQSGRRARRWPSTSRRCIPSGVPIVFGAMRDKDVARMLARSRPSRHATSSVTAPAIARAAEPASLARVAQAGRRIAPIDVEPSPMRAIERAGARPRPSWPVRSFSSAICWRHWTRRSATAPTASLSTLLALACRACYSPKTFAVLMRRHHGCRWPALCAVWSRGAPGRGAATQLAMLRARRHGRSTRSARTHLKLTDRSEVDCSDMKFFADEDRDLHRHRSA